MRVPSVRAHVLFGMVLRLFVEYDVRRLPTSRAENPRVCRPQCLRRHLSSAEDMPSTGTRPRANVTEVRVPAPMSSPQSAGAVQWWRGEGVEVEARRRAGWREMRVER